MSSSKSFTELARAVINTEADAVKEMLNHLDDAFVRSCNLILNTQGRLVVVGMGKSGHIGSKIAATMASTGTPAFFVHPGEASHGDLGMITSEDVILALSNSGSTDEVISLLPVIKRKGIPLIAMTGNPESKLATTATVHINVHVTHEACPLGLAPTASTTATLAMGDALAVALMSSRGFTADDFALSHPGGSLGRRLLLYIDELMHTGDDLPIVTPNTIVADALLEMTSKRLGMTAVVENEQLVGIFTDGDLRRSIENKIDLHNTKISETMISNCKTLALGTLAAEAVQIMEQYSITVLIVVDNENHPIGALHMHDLLRAGVV